MEYKYHPIYKYLFFFVITYAYMKHQTIMEDKILLVNSIVLTIFVMIVDQMFIHNNLTIFQPLSDQYFDDNAQIKITEKQLEQEIKEEKIYTAASSFGFGGTNANVILSSYKNKIERNNSDYIFNKKYII